MTRLLVSVLSSVCRLWPVVVQENCSLACTRIVILRLRWRLLEPCSFHEQRMILINVSEFKVRLGVVSLQAGKWSQFVGERYELLVRGDLKFFG